MGTIGKLTMFAGIEAALNIHSEQRSQTLRRYYFTHQRLQKLLKLASGAKWDTYWECCTSGEVFGALGNVMEITFGEALQGRFFEWNFGVCN